MRYTSALFMMVLAACGGDDGRRGEDGIILADSAGIQIVTVRGLDVETLPTWSVDPVPVVEIGRADGGAGHDLHWPRAATRLPGGGIILANTGSNEILEYDAAGSFVRALGRKGAGPGEFENLSWTGSLAGDTILGYDPPNRRLTVFTPEGAVARTVTLPLPNTSSFPEITDNLADGSLLAYPGFDRMFGRGERRDTIAWMVYPPDGSRADTIGSYAGPERFFHVGTDMAMTMNVPFGRDAFATARGEHIVIGSNDSLSLDVFSGDGALVRRIRVMMPALPVSRAEAAAQKDTTLAAVPAQFAGPYRTMLDEVPERDTHPAFTGLLLDDDGRIWVRLAARPGTQATWLVLSSTGAPIARVDLDAALEMEEVGADYVLVRTTDVDGVERVRLHSLSRG